MLWVGTYVNLGYVLLSKIVQYILSIVYVTYTVDVRAHSLFPGAYQLPLCTTHSDDNLEAAPPHSESQIFFPLGEL